MRKTLPYCIDSSALIAAWDERYPPDIFPGFWQLFETMLNSGRILMHESVIDELDKKSKDLCIWLKAFPAAIVPFEPEIQLKSRELLVKYQRLVMERKLATSADPFVIATAMVKGLIVVTEEGSTNNMSKPKIPDVCRAENLDCIKLIDMIRSEAWVI